MNHHSNAGHEWEAGWGEDGLSPESIGQQPASEPVISPNLAWLAWPPCMVSHHHFTESLSLHPAAYPAVN